jgi:hypothetical protein
MANPSTWATNAMRNLKKKNAPAAAAPNYIKLSELLQAGGIYAGEDYRTMGPVAMLHLFNSHLPDEPLLHTVFYIRNKDNASFVAVQLFHIARSTEVGKEDTYFFRLYNGEMAMTRGSSFRGLIESGRVFTEENTPYQQYMPYPAHIAPAPYAMSPVPPPPQQRIQTHISRRELKNILNTMPPRGGRSKRRKHSKRRRRTCHRK